ncbi:MAG: hypothetical protein KF832_31640, partial [Caldilineaceae bacterium]|nr:hypothetical protein [Caldilineaceae bacterium]
AGWVFLFCAVMFFSPKSLGNYATIFIMPLTFLVVTFQDRLALWLMLGLNLLVSVQPSFWYRLGAPQFISLSSFDQPLLLIEFVMEIAILAVLAGLMIRAWQWAATVDQLVVDKPCVKQVAIT